MAKKKEVQEVQKVETPWHSMDLEAVYKELGKDGGLPKSGLTTREAEERLAKYGENKLSEKEKVTLLMRIWKQVGNVLVGILVFVAVVSAIRAIMAMATTVVREDYATEEEFAAKKEENDQNILTNWIQVGIILLVIM